MVRGEQRHKALLIARAKEEERRADSPLGMDATAAQLRRAAQDMVDSNDRDAMLRLAAGYAQRAARAATWSAVADPARYSW